MIAIHPFLADAGVPMLFLQMPVLIITLPIVIAIEAFLCRRWLNLSWKKAWWGTFLANVVSTLFGFPLLWVAMLFLPVVFHGSGVPNLTEPWLSVYSVTVQAAWLGAGEERYYWMIPTAALVLLVPAFFLTIYIEGKIYRRVFKDSQGIPSATWRMHYISYAFLCAIGIGLLVCSLASHH